MNLDSELIVETPEHVQLRFAVAGVGTRFLAALIDHLLQMAGLITVGLFVWLFWDFARALAGEEGGKWLYAVWVFVAGGLVLLIIGYFTVFETMWSGQTPGKRWMKLRVIREDGRAISFFEALVRNLLRLIDFMPSGYAFGVVSIILSDESRRLGDYVAGTVVVKERASEAPTLLQVLERHDEETRRQAWNPQMVRLDVRRLTEDEITAVETFLIRRDGLPPATRPWTASRIAFPLMQKLQVTVPFANPELFLEEVDRQYKAQAKYLVD